MGFWWGGGAGGGGVLVFSLGTLTGKRGLCPWFSRVSRGWVGHCLQP